MEGLTARQQEILDMIREFIANSGFPPTRVEICRAMGFSSPNAAQEHLRTLERKGMIEMLSSASRGIRKRLKYSGNQVQLLAENPDFKPIKIDPRREPLAIEGIAVGVIRSAVT